MPLYLYRCRHCGHKFELLRSMNQKDEEVACPECGVKKAEKVISACYPSYSSGKSGGFT